ncbi:protein kinase subdomain-containing protein PKL/CAK/Fmp29 [Roridomyces roridus]|uniref:Protein kinase subdomain-containing protein PKL/CAK/Fmp29 n=1 Tax=Roridomyces roridus TaxID=1738132 RepID=A0AAD7B0L0_9AGAR|nr:protein kinase subdomain-containing protein PKL/CAK/Fmp29 [Roridomyces roridus]
MQCIFRIMRIVKLRSPAFLRLPRGPSSFACLPGSWRALHTKNAAPDDLFNSTSGRWIYNEALRLSERRTIFNIAGLRLLAAQSVGRTPSDIISLTKLAEGSWNRSFLITMRDDFQMVARIPYPCNEPSYYLLASEVATMDYLRNVVGIPIPQVYGYSAEEENAAETRYIFMEYMRGSELRDVSSSFGEKDIVSVVRQLVKLEAKMMGVEFPAGSSLYYARDLENVSAGKGVPMPDDPRFCVGSDVRASLWRGRRSQLEVNRGPYKTMQDALVRGAHKELAFLERFGQPLFPFYRSRREAYNYQEQLPSDRAESLNRYLLIAPSIVPHDPALSSFRIRHPDLSHEGNILVSKTSDSDEWKICSLIDWQYASILPISLSAGIPGCVDKNDGDPSFDPKTRPSLPVDFADLDDVLQDRELDRLRRHLRHYLYLKDTEELNPLHHAAMTDPPNAAPPTSLRPILLPVTREWDALAGPAAGPCPIAFDSEDVTAANRWHKDQVAVELNLMFCLSVVGCGTKGWVNKEEYEEVLLESQRMKEMLLELAESPEERDAFLAHWFFDDMDEEKYR